MRGGTAQFYSCNNVILPACSWAFDKFEQSINRMHRLNSPWPVNVRSVKGVYVRVLKKQFCDRRRCLFTSFCRRKIQLVTCMKLKYGG
jgi:hypothetical protein